MHSFFRVHLRPVLALVGSLGIVGGMAAFRAQADEWNKKTILTVNEPIQVTNTVLDPGKYVFMLDNSSTDRHVVRIFNEDQSHLIDTVMAMPNYRIQPTGSSRFMFWETPPGTAKALRASFYPGDNFGQEFQYPKHPKVLTAEATTPRSPVAQTEPAPAPREVTQPEEPQPSPEASTQTAPAEQQPAEQPPEVAQNNPPAPAPEAQPAPNQQPPQQTQPRELPQTSSPYTWVGFSGIILLGLAGLVRLRRWA